MDYTFIKLKWRTNPFSAEIWYNQPDKSDITRHPLQIGDEIQIRIGGRRFCIGSESGKGEWISCYTRQKNDGEQPKQALEFVHPDDVTQDSDTSHILVDSKKYIQCYRCSMKEYFSCRMTCSGDFCDPTSAVAKKLCEPAKTVVYLTYVGGTYKIGVSLNYQRRWIEQGSELAVKIAKLPGLEARRLEQLGAQKLGLALQVRGKTKLNNINLTNTDKAKARMNEILPDLLELAKKLVSDNGGEVFDPPEIVDLTDYYGERDDSKAVNIVEVEDSAEFGGEIVSIQGSIIVTKQNGYYYALDFKQLISSSFHFMNKKASMPTQSQLDQWF